MSFGDAFKTLSTWAANVNMALSAVQHRLASKKLKLPRCAAGRIISISTPWSSSAAAAPWGSALPGDEFCDEPYSTPRCGRSRRSRAAAVAGDAHWHTYKFLAALAPAHKIVAAHDQGEYVRQFLDVSVHARARRAG